MMKKIFILLGALGLVAAVFLWKWVERPVISVSEQVCKQRLTANELFDAYSNHQSSADSCYTKQIIEVTGKIRSLSADGPQKSLILETNDMIFGIDCGLDSTQYDKIKSLQVGQSVKIKGECAGLLSDVIMIRCVLM